ncbi:hypothetical protein GCM10027160_33160 [Streptomyces calidiresistens]
MEGVRPPSRAPPSIWYEAVADPHRKSEGKVIRLLSVMEALPCVVCEGCGGAGRCTGFAPVRPVPLRSDARLVRAAPVGPRPRAPALACRDPGPGSDGSGTGAGRPPAPVLSP